MTVMAAASLGLRGAGPGTLVVREPVGGPRFPNGMIAGGDAVGGAVSRAEVEVLAGTVQARRWWDPTSPTITPDSAAVAAFLARVPPAALPAEPVDCIGWGPGLTPAGDDVVVGLLIGLHMLGRTAEAAALADACAPADTAPLSRALLDHAARGEAAAPVLAVVRALGGSGPLTAAITDLEAFGATSGHHLLDGIRRALVATGVGREAVLT